MRLSLLALGSLFIASFAGTAAARECVEWNTGWQFTLDDSITTTSPAATSNAPEWQRIVLPHDWSIMGVVDVKAPSSGAGGFFQTGIGWYRREFSGLAEWRGKRVVVEFEGIYMNAEVTLNGVSIIKQPYGYTTFFADLTPHLRIGETNVLTVRVDNSAQPNCRWYSGSGIYRPVRLHITEQVCVEPQGVFVSTTGLNEKTASIRVETTVRNYMTRVSDLAIETSIIDPDGQKVTTVQTNGSAAASTAFSTITTLSIASPRTWSPETPVLYHVLTRVRSGTKLLDEVATPFGVRTVRVSSEHGFELNGQTLKLIGGNVHHDNGPLGAASFSRAEERKVELLKAAGFNAVRTSHNPPATAFLEACDRLGLLVMDEAFDGWKLSKNPHDYGIYFNDWWRHDLDAMIRRDRNHPSIVLWSLGNEMFERGNANGLRIANALTRRVRELDPSRPVTAGVNGMGKNGEWSQLDPLFATFDLAGYNYELTNHADDHKRLPHRVIVAAESYLSETFANWATTHDNTYVVGDFVWSAIDYLGESGIGRVFPPGVPIVKHWEGNQFPWHGAACGDIDLTGWRKPISHYRNIVWDRGEKLYVAVVAPAPGGGEWGISPWAVESALPSWTWPGHEGRALTVNVYSRFDTVKLFLNGKLLGEKPTTRGEQFKADFQVPYAQGKLEAVGMLGGREMARMTLATAGAPAQLRLTADRSQFAAGQQDLIFVNVEMLDKNGVLVPDSEAVVSYTLDGPATLAGIGSADLTTRESYQANPRRLFQGRALVIIRSGDSPALIKLTASTPGLAPVEIPLTAIKAQ